MRLVETVRFRRGKLPHWEVDGGRYFVSVRLADSLPRGAVLRLEEIHKAISHVEARSNAFADLQRQYFRAMEKYLDAGAGSCILRDPANAEIVAMELSALADWEIDVPHYTVMPNHWHALIVPRPHCVHSLGAIMKRIKGRTAKKLRRLSGGTGPVWQRECFDRWVRNDSEWERMVSYIHDNPVKAGLTTSWKDHLWTK
jgi:REP element-mobilizing transposase RayT